MARTNHSEPSTKVTLSRNGRTYTAFYRFERGFVTVTSLNGQKAAQVLGGDTAESVARSLLGELADVGNAE